MYKFGTNLVTFYLRKSIWFYVVVFNEQNHIITCRHTTPENHYPFLCSPVKIKPLTTIYTSIQIVLYPIVANKKLPLYSRKLLRARLARLTMISRKNIIFGLHFRKNFLWLSRIMVWVHVSFSACRHFHPVYFFINNIEKDFGVRTYNLRDNLQFYTCK